jgi:Bacterial Ig-like domain (group 3)
LTVDYVTASPGPVSITYGQNATFTAASADPTGSDWVAWQVNTDGGKTFSPLSDGGVDSGTATTTLTLTEPVVAYSGYEYEANFTNSAGTLTTGAATLTVGKVTPAVSVSLTKSWTGTNISAVGDTITLTASVTSSAGVPTGTVQVYVDSHPYQSPVPLVTGSACLNTSGLTLGMHSITVVYNGDDNFATSNDNAMPMTQTVLGPGVVLLSPAVYIVGGPTSNDQVQISPTGTSINGSTGVVVQGNLAAHTPTRPTTNRLPGFLPTSITATTTFRSPIV